MVIKEKVSVIFNTDSLGGAERSMIEQLRLVHNQINLSVYVPSLEVSQKQLIHQVQESLKCELRSFRFPSAFYRISRQGSIKNYLSAIFSILTSFKLFRDLSALKQQDILYCNGNKASTWILFWALIQRFQGKIIWHFRDYPEKSKSLRYLILLCQVLGNFKLEFVANSFSVREALLKELSIREAHVVYNKTSMLDIYSKKNEIQKLAVVSMLAPWKGIKQVMQFAYRNEVELKLMGITELSIYTNAIYKTNGEHENYHDELMQTMQESGSQFVRFYYGFSPEKIFSQIDLLLHSSLKPEPFGRVILEAFQAGVPVISTGLGGSGELVCEGTNGLVYNHDDEKSLMTQICRLVKDKDLRDNLVTSAKAFGQKIESSVDRDFSKIFDIAS